MKMQMPSPDYTHPRNNKSRVYLVATPNHCTHHNLTIMNLTTLMILTAYLDFNTYPPNYSAEQWAKLRWQAVPYFLWDGTLFKYNKQNEQQPLWVISTKELEIVLYSTHISSSSGHFTEKKTIQWILERYYWPTIGRDDKSYIQKCNACQRQGTPKVNELLHPIKVGQPFLE